MRPPNKHYWYHSCLVLMAFGKLGNGAPLRTRHLLSNGEPAHNLVSGPVCHCFMRFPNGKQSNVTLSVTLYG